jgi:two-component sensor histidine kinase/PAS domain-containing protein
LDLTTDNNRDVDAIGESQMAGLMRDHNWAKTPLGPAEHWPQSLKTAAGICLESRFPIVLWWGADFVVIYNDDYRPILGDKHPRALGRAGREVWGDVWPVFGPMLESVMRSGEATQSRDLLLVMNRHGYDEETYLTFSYSPIRDESSRVAGVFTPVIETTGQVIRERRLRTLRDLATRARAETAVEACRSAASALSLNGHDMPFAMIYLIDADRKHARLAATAGITPGETASPEVVDMTTRDLWSLGEVARTNHIVEIAKLPPRLGKLPTGAWPVPPRSAIVLPVVVPGHEGPEAILVAAVSPRRALDDEYRSFYNLVGQQVASAMAEALAYERERQRAEAAQALGQTEARLAFALEAGRLGYWEMQPIRERLITSDIYKANWGRSPNDEFSYETLRASVHPDDYVLHEQAIDDAIRSKGQLDIEYRVIWPDGSEHWLRVRGQASYDETGKPVRMAGISLDVTDRKHAEDALRREIAERTRVEQHQELLLAELNHRVKNTLAIVLSIATQTLRHADTAEAFRAGFEARIMALAEAHNLLTESNWEGASLRVMLERVLGPYRGGGKPRYDLGQQVDVRVGPKTAVALVMAFNELATNAAKYGALSGVAGLVNVRWDVTGEAPQRLRISWEETGGPPVRQPKRTGFGTRLISGLSEDAGGKVKMDFVRTGLVCQFDLPLSTGSAS